MGQYNYKITSIPALPRSAMRRARHLSASGSISTLHGGDGGGGNPADYVKWSDIIKSVDTVPKEYLDTNIMSSLVVKTLIDMHDHAGRLIRPGVFVVPAVGPEELDIELEEDETALFLDDSGSFVEEPSGDGAVTEVFKLYLQRNGVQVGVFDPATADATLNISVPTTLATLLDDSSHRLVTDVLINTWTAKQDAISDLSDIRNNASLGATAYSWGNHATAGYATASALSSYLPLAGGTMANTDLVTNLNADLLDGLHSKEQRVLGNATSASGTRAFAAGYQATANGNYSVAIGRAASTEVSYAYAIGYNAISRGQYANAIGSEAWAGFEDTGDSSKKYLHHSALTPKQVTYNSENVYGIWALGNTTVSFTYNGSSYSLTTQNSVTTNYRAIFVIETTSDTWLRDTAPYNVALFLDDNKEALANHSIVQVKELTTGVYAIETGAVSTTANVTNPLNTNGVRCFILTKLASSSYVPNNSYAIGYHAVVGAGSAYAMGTYAYSGGTYGTAIGYMSFVNGSSSCAIGSYSASTGNYSAAIGYNATAVGGNSLALGYSATTSGSYSIAIGINANSSGRSSVAIGTDSNAKNNSSFAIGTGLTTGRDTQIVLGRYNAVDTSSQLVFGNGSADNDKRNILTLATNGTLTLLGGLTTGSNVLPSTNNSYDLGSSSAKWRDLYLSRDAVIGGSLTVTGLTTVASLKANTILPNADCTYNLGSDSYNWNMIYSDGIEAQSYVRTSLVTASTLQSESQSQYTIDLDDGVVGDGTPMARVNSAVVDVSAALSVPTTEPVNPEQGKVYIVFDDSGSLAV